MARKTHKRRHGGRKAATLDLTAQEIDRDEGVIIVEPGQQASRQEDDDAQGKTLDSASQDTSSPAEVGTSPDAALDEGASVDEEKAEDLPPSAPPTDGSEVPAEEPLTARQTTATVDTAPEDSPPLASPPPRRQAGGGMLSHALAGLVGGALVFLLFGPLSGLLTSVVPALQGGGSPSTVLDALRGRVTSLERAVTTIQQAGKVDPGALSQLGDRVARMEEQIASLSRAQRALQETAGQMAASGAAETGDTAPKSLVARIAALENRLRAGDDSAITDAQGETGAGRLAVLQKEMQAALASLREAPRVTPEQIAQLEERIETLLTQTSDLRRDFAGMRSLADAVKTRTDELGARLAALPNIDTRLAPLRERLERLTNEVEGVVAREKAMRAEGRNAALIIALGNLTRAVHSGEAYAGALIAFKSLAPPGTDLTSLERHAQTGLPPLAKLRTHFHKVAHEVQVAETAGEGSGWVGRVLANARNVVQVKSSKPLTGNSTRAVLSRMGAALEKGQLGLALDESRGLNEQARRIMRPWLDRAQAKHAADSFLNHLRTRTLAALAGPADGSTN